METQTQKEIAVFGGGCFWCTEAVFRMMKGVSSVLPGYAGGATLNPTYAEVSQGNTGHAEVVRIEYDPALVSYKSLLTVFFGSHDPTTLNQQGADIGTQYRSIVFTTTPAQEAEVKEFIAGMNASNSAGAPVVTQVEPLTKFYEAEDYHRDYYANHANAGYCQVVINPKLEKVQKEFADLLETIQK
ncbi:MAG: peptide-methionine (S)-S-oxide reductase MsrA [Patescibacteria group bacterium]